mgnify:CR=1 FL=1
MSTRFVLLVAMMSLSLPNLSAAQNFGKVFSTPAQREFLDRERDEALRELSEQERLALLDAPPAVQDIVRIEPTLIHMGGSVRRADGNHTIWLNGVAVNLSDLPANARLEFVNGLGVLRVRGADREYIVRPGQTLNANSGDIREDYELNEEELKKVNDEVAAREAAARPVRTARNSPEVDAVDETDISDENKTLIQNIVDGLQMLQQARSIQEGAQ